MNSTKYKGKKSNRPFMGLSRHVILPVSLLSQLLIIQGNNDNDKNSNECIFYLSK